MSYETDCYINGQWVQGEGEVFSSIDPSREAVVWQGHAASSKQVDLACQAAHAAQNKWGQLGYEKRAKIVRKFRNLIELHKPKIAKSISIETGKALWDSLGEVGAMIGKIALSESSYGQRTGHETKQFDGFSSALRHKAHGVVAVFGPYNFPCHLPNGHIVPALLAGNCILFKPSEITPKTGGLMVDLWHQAGLPNGVMNLLQGEKSVGMALAKADINGLFFTGSSATGKLIHQQFGGRPEVMLALEMGGNNPLIVWDVKDVEAVCYHIIQSAFISSGQRCTCARRLIIETDKADEILATLTQMTSNLTIGLWDDEQPPYMSALVSGKVATNYMLACEQLVQNGGVPILMPQRLRDIEALVTPAIIDVTNAQLIEDEEIFAPLLQVYRVDDFAAAIELANNTKYGLSAGVISDDRGLYERFLASSNAGIINFNRQTTGASGAAPFGGVGCSGNHRPSAFYAADYCAYPIASMEAEKPVLPANLPVGFNRQQVNDDI
ncbi:MAG: succinylglutamate-semialdehyde dehydrogenase [Rhizobiales bacterium]|nr:succinylglutamate-semialdehyde dehydrogenase [Hyphomicrobiales bacterium]NRB14363.1 succinylglutamate-semialdehyde dehydrogenase [Hyphomicrobiales bacterium]